MNQNVRVFEIVGAEGEWIAARSKKQALRFYIEECEPDHAEDLDPDVDVKLVTPDELNTLEYDPDGSGSNVISFRERLDQIIDNEEKVPTIFARAE